ncbi:hypothetical protein PR048_022561 [Dryococelus australis]|uniref:Uncharacterized protein n=1 Tax=Dryococelus australis TaxID=614101 RepID=A0ABQ9H1F2_9NEOP|nr:hypothetical protein PR048_022561 [Dryococelus australis]
MPLIGGFSRGSPVSPAFAFRRRSILNSLHPHRLKTPMLRRLPGQAAVLLTSAHEEYGDTCVFRRDTYVGEWPGYRVNGQQQHSKTYRREPVPRRVGSRVCGWSRSPGDPGPAPELPATLLAPAPPPARVLSREPPPASAAGLPAPFAAPGLAGTRPAAPPPAPTLQLHDIHGDSSPFLLQPFHELSNGFWPRLTSPHPAIQFVPKMFYKVEVGALGGPLRYEHGNSGGVAYRLRAVEWQCVRRGVAEPVGGLDHAYTAPLNEAPTPKASHQTSEIELERSEDVMPESHSLDAHDTTANS